MTQDEQNNSPEIPEKIEIFSTDDEKIKSFGELLTNDSSRSILQLLFTEEMTANEIAQKTGVSLQLVKYHINKMVDMGIAKISKVEKNTKAQDMKYYTATKFAIVILPKTVSEKAKESKSLLRSFKILYKFAGVGVAAVSAFFATQSIQNFTITDERAQTGSISLDRTAPPEEPAFESGEDFTEEELSEFDSAQEPQTEPSPPPQPESEPTHGGVEQFDPTTGSGYLGDSGEYTLEEALEIQRRTVEATQSGSADSWGIGSENFWPIIVAIAVLGIGLAVIFFWHAYKSKDVSQKIGTGKLGLYGLLLLVFTIMSYVLSAQARMLVT